MDGVGSLVPSTDPKKKVPLDETFVPAAGYTWAVSLLIPNHRPAAEKSKLFILEGWS